MINVATKQQNSNSIPIWNPEFVINKDKISGNNMLCFPIQNDKLLNFKHFKVLSAFDIKLDFKKIDSLGLYKYCDGSNTIERICEIIRSENPEVTESAVKDQLEKMARMGIITLI